MNNKSNRHVRQNVLMFAIPAIAIGMLPAAAAAQEWVLQPEIRLGAEYDDNSRLRAESAAVQEIDGFIAEGSLGIGYNTQRSQFELTPRARSRNYDETPDVDSDDFFLDMDYDFEGLKSEFSIDGSYEIESIRTAERTDVDFGEDDPGEIPTDPTGITFSNDERNRFRVSPSWQYEVTERTSIGARYVYLDVSYDNAQANFLQDYTDHRVEATIGRMFTERTRGYIGAGARRYENDLGTNQIDGVGGMIGIESEFSEVTTLQAEVGYERTEREGTGESDNNVVGNLSLVRRLETVTLLAQYRRNVAAGGSGRVTARDSLNFNLNKQFTERVSGGIGVRAYQTDAVGSQAVTIEERDQSEISAQLTVALSRAFSVQGEYSYTRLDRTDAEGTADSNNVFLWLVYRPTPIIN